MNVTRCHHSNNGTPSNAQLLVGISIVEEFCSRIMPPKKKKGKSNINKKNKKANEGMFICFLRAAYCYIFDLICLIFVII